MGRSVRRGLAGSWGVRPWLLHLHRNQREAEKITAGHDHLWGDQNSSSRDGTKSLLFSSEWHSESGESGSGGRQSYLFAALPTRLQRANIYHFTMHVGPHIWPKGEFKFVLPAASERIWVYIYHVGELTWLEVLALFIITRRAWSGHGANHKSSKLYSLKPMPFNTQLLWLRQYCTISHWIHFLLLCDLRGSTNFGQGILLPKTKILYFLKGTEATKGSHEVSHRNRMIR